MGYFLTKLQISRVNYCKIIDSWNAKFLRYFETRKRSVCMTFRSPLIGSLLIKSLAIRKVLNIIKSVNYFCKVNVFVSDMFLSTFITDIRNINNSISEN